ncbi:HNH endonuclease, partial [Escherichia coli]
GEKRVFLVILFTSFSGSLVSRISGAVHQRGYGSKWDVIRGRVLKRDKGLCQLCLRAGVVREAKTVDHIIPKAHGGTDADSNLQSLCWPCHKAKTARERLK